MDLKLLNSKEVRMGQTMKLHLVILRINLELFKMDLELLDVKEVRIGQIAELHLAILGINLKLLRMDLTLLKTNLKLLDSKEV